MSDLKKPVLDFLRDLPESPFEQFNKAFELYRNSSKKNKINEASYNRRGYSEQGLKNLLYDLKKAYEITDVDVFSNSEPITEKVIASTNTIADAFEKLSEETKDSILKAAILLEKFQDLIENSEPLKESVAIGTSYFETFKNENIELVISENKDFSMSDILSAKLEENPLLIDTYINNIDVDETPVDTAGKVLKLDAGVNTETETSLRAEFPFLNNPDCPQILYVVVGKRIATYNKHKELHAKLQEINEGKLEATPEELKYITAECDFAFSDNRALWDELNHYATTNEILGKHPIFREDNIKKEVETMTNEQLFKYINATSKFFTEQKKQLEKHKDDAVKIAEINSKIEDRKYKLSLVKAKAGVVDAGEKK
ncbi:hypothetical protein [Flavobacterium facile]|uniref:hypothetical protein n=1 Tax=Flavobacterium facile TaxID=2893174 RepID=UPI002E7A178A|nr:hypothetical protein [Flavobacterium sp. T-12]